MMENKDNKKKKTNNKKYYAPKKKIKEIVPIVLPDLWPEGKVGAIEYHMPTEVADDLLKNRKGADLKMAPQAFLCKYVDEQYGLMYRCVKVVLI